jgi:hypothetical protein
MAETSGERRSEKAITVIFATSKTIYLFIKKLPLLVLRLLGL